MLAGEQEAHQAALADLEGLDGDVEAARNEVFAAINAATALRHAIQSAAASRERVTQTLGTLEVEEGDLRVEREALATARVAAEEGLREAHAAHGRARGLRETHEAALADARSEHDALARDLRAREHALAGLTRGCGRSRSSMPSAPGTAMPCASCSPRRMAPSDSMGRSRITSTWMAGTKRAAEALLGNLSST